MSLLIIVCNTLQTGQEYEVAIAFLSYVLYTKLNRTAKPWVLNQGHCIDSF
jgi:hypothetical protein